MDPLKVVQNTTPKNLSHRDEVDEGRDGAGADARRRDVLCGLAHGADAAPRHHVEKDGTDGEREDDHREPRNPNRAWPRTGTAILHAAA